MVTNHEHLWQKPGPDDGDCEAICHCGAWRKNGAIVEIIHPGTPEWDESEIALERQRRRGL